jgi:hypothetical protein
MGKFEQIVKKFSEKRAKQKIAVGEQSIVLTIPKEIEILET